MATVIPSNPDQTPERTLELVVADPNSRPTDDDSRRNTTDVDTRNKAPTTGEHTPSDNLEFSVGKVAAATNTDVHTVVDVAPFPQIPGYEIQKELGRGGFGVVYLARQDGLKRNVAVKVLLPPAQTSSAAQRRFKAELEAVGKIEHPNVVVAFAVGETSDRRQFLAMEYMQGGTLHDKLQSALPLREGLEIVRQSAEGLAAAHAAKIVHRDLKPENILLSVNSRGGLCAKVGDFGLASLRHSEASMTSEHSSETLVGTLTHMAPESFDGEAEVNDRADMYALGCILYRMITGKILFSGPNMTVAAQWMRAHMQVSVPDFSEQCKDFPGLHELVHNLLAKDPSERMSAEDAASNLSRILSRKEVSISLPKKANVQKGVFERIGSSRIAIAAAVLAAIGGGAGVISTLPKNNRNDRASNVAPSNLVKNGAVPQNNQVSINEEAAEIPPPPVPMPPGDYEKHSFPDGSYRYIWNIPSDIDVFSEKDKPYMLEVAEYFKLLFSNAGGSEGSLPAHEWWTNLRLVVDVNSRGDLEIKVASANIPPSSASIIAGMRTSYTGPVGIQFAKTFEKKR